MLVLAAFLVAQSSVAPAPRVETVAAKVRACGFKNVSVKDDPELQEDVIAVTDVSGVSHDQLVCAANASVGSAYFVEFPPSLDGEYQEIYWALAEQWGKQKSREWLKRHGLLAKLPIYRAGGDDLAFGRQLEALCGPKAQGVFVRREGHVTMDIGTPEKPRFDSQTFECLINVISTSGMPFGFVGNEYIAPERK
jgi:hypothetical protein